jgi:hypothetical protein
MSQLLQLDITNQIQKVVICIKYLENWLLNYLFV